MAERLRRWLKAHWLVLATGLAAGLPVVVATVDAVGKGWQPLADNALIAVSSYDVLSADSPLLGPWSSGYSAVVGQSTFHPGPLLFWLLAIPARLSWSGAFVVTAALVNLACVIGIVALAQRRGGRPLMFAAALAVTAMLASLPAAAYSDIWNPSVPLLPFTLLIFVAWSLACGDHRLLPLAVLLASFVVQCHLTFLGPAAAALVVGVGGLVLTQRSELLRARRWIVAALAVGAVCWSAPAIDQLTNDPGNVRLIYRAVRADQAKLGADAGWRGLVHTVGVVPWWLRDPQFPLQRIVDLGRSASALATVSALLILAALAVLAAVAARRRRWDVVAATVLALALCATVPIVTASTPQSSFATLAYSLRWTSPTGMWAWLALGWSLATLFAGARLPLARLRPLAPVGVAVVAALGVVVAAAGGLRNEPYDQTVAFADAIERELPAKRPIRLVASASPGAGFMALGIQSGLLYALRSDGRDVAADSVVAYLGPEYKAKPSDQLVRIDVGTEPPAEGRVVARASVRQYPEPQAPAGATEEAARWDAAVTLVPAAQAAPRRRDEAAASRR